MEIRASVNHMSKSKIANQNDVLMYNDLMKCILNFQLEEHETFLSHFNKLYKIIDVDNKGHIDSNLLQLNLFIMSEIILEFRRNGK